MAGIVLADAYRLLGRADAMLRCAAFAHRTCLQIRHGLFRHLHGNTNGHMAARSGARQRVDGASAAESWLRWGLPIRRTTRSATFKSR